MHQPDGDETVLVLHGRAFVEMDEDRRTSLTHRFLDTGAEKLLPMYRIDEKADVSRMLIATGETGPAYAETARSGP